VLPRVVLIGGLVALAVAVAVTLAERGARQAGSNRIPAGQFVAQLPARKTLCQDGELVPGDSAGLKLTVGTYHRPGPPVRVTITRSGQPVADGGLAAGWTQGNHVRFPIAPVRRTTQGSRVCLTNAGPATLALGGSPTAELPARLDGRRTPGRVRIEYVRPGRESWWSLLPTVSYRFGLGKAPGLGAWTLALAVGLALSAIGAAAWLLARAGAR
jgi:hypothetical protein